MNNPIIWIPTVVLGVIGLILLVAFLYYTFAPVRQRSAPARPRAPEPKPAYAPPPPRPASAPAPVAAPASNATVLEDESFFTVMSGLEPGLQIPLPADQFGIGRYENLDTNILVSIDENTVSRNHALFRVNRQTREYFIQDIGSTYGTFLVLDGQPQKLNPNQEERIYNQDILKFGNNVQVQITIPCDVRSAVTRL